MLVLMMKLMLKLMLKLMTMMLMKLMMMLMPMMLRLPHILHSSLLRMFPLYTTFSGYENLSSHDLFGDIVRGFSNMSRPTF